MKKLILFLLFAAYGFAAWAQNDTTEKYKFAFHGFVNPHYYADSREVVGGREDMMLFYPKPVAPDANGNDLNEGWQANMMAITARLGLRVTGPNTLGAKTSAYVEGDFTGSTNATINNLRLRHAYIDMRWDVHRCIGKRDNTSTHHLLMGQYWYAMQIHEVMPLTNPLNMGAPFALYARYNQVRYEYLDGSGMEAVAAAAWQLDNSSQGELNGAYTNSTSFARHSLIPELTAQLRYRGQHLFVGGAVNLKTLQLQVPLTTLNSRTHTSVSYSLFGKLSIGNCDIKAQTLFNNSLYEGCSLGGYLFLTNGDVEDWHFNTYWIDISRRNGRLRPGIFMGYAQNLDYGGHSDATHIFGRGHDIAELWRIQPRLQYRMSECLFCTAEAEYTHAAYDTPVGNLRLSLTIQYDF